MIRKVTVREQLISGNRKSLFLDYYPAVEHPITGKQTRREFLNLCVFNDTEVKEYIYLDKKGIKRIKFTPVYTERLDRKGNTIIKLKPRKLSVSEKLHNKSVLILAEQIRQKKENEINRPEVYSEFEKEQIRFKELGNKSFISYFERLADQRKDKNRLIWTSAIKYLKAFAGKDVQFKDLNNEFCDNFRHFLITTKSRKSKTRSLAVNSTHSYFNRFRAALKQAFKDSYLRFDLNGKIESIKAEETIRVRLTEEELNQLVKTDCLNPLMKRAALFSALTGLRFSDIHNLLWENVEFIQDLGYCINFRVQKTNGIQFLPISNQAASLMGQRKEPHFKVFEGLVYSAAENKIMAQWGIDAKINKKINWHTMRHSWASIQVTKGTNMKLIQTALGHKHLTTTEIYAKAENRLLREVMNQIKLDM